MLPLAFFMLKILPFYWKKYETDLGGSVIVERIKKQVSDPDWNLTVAKAINNRIMEGEIFDTGFLVVMGKYGLTYGRTSLLPIMKGRLSYDVQRKKRECKMNCVKSYI